MSGGGLEITHDENSEAVLNVVIVGDTGVGKTNLVLSYAIDQFI